MKEEGVKMKKNEKQCEKKHGLQFEKTYILYSSFLAGPNELCISKMISKAWEGVLITF